MRKAFLLFFSQLVAKKKAKFPDEHKNASFKKNLRFFEFRKRREIVNFKSKYSAKTKAPTKKMNETKFVELTFYFWS